MTLEARLLAVCVGMLTYLVVRDLFAEWRSFLAKQALLEALRDADAARVIIARPPTPDAPPEDQT